MGAPIKPPAKPHPEILPYLEKHSIGWADFSKRMTRDPEVKRIRALVVTDLHQKGKTWKEMTEITSFGAGQLRKYTRAVGCAASSRNRKENAVRVGRARAGEKKPWLSESLCARWAAGDFDFHRGRERSEEERQRLVEGWTPERRAKQALHKKKLWEDHDFRSRMEAFHRDPQERARRSEAQVRRMRENPEKWTRGRGAWVEGKKCLNGPRFWVRSGLEVVAVRVLEADETVVSYLYEPPFVDEEGKIALPDFKVWETEESWKIVEVKASWVLSLPLDHRHQQGVSRYREIADKLEVPFEVWTEKDVLHEY